MTAKEENVPELIRRFASVGMTAKSIGRVDGTQELRVHFKDEDTRVFEFVHNGVMHLFSEDLPCRIR
jgi:selenophosphate synthetase-related protein